MSKIINQSAVRRYALDVLAQERPHLAGKFTRVGEDFFNAIETQTRALIRARIVNMPSVGKTLR